MEHKHLDRVRGHSGPLRIGRTITGSGPLKSYDLSPVPSWFSGFAIPREPTHRGGIPLTLRKALTAGVLALTLSAAAPAHLLSAERKAPAVQHTAALEWLSTLWHEVAALFGADTTPPPVRPVGGPTTDGRCTVDPDGGGCTP